MPKQTPPLKPTRVLEVPAIRYAQTLFAGLRQEWLSGGDDEVQFNVTSGAGLGSPYMVLTVTMHDKTVYEVINVAELANDWVHKVIEDWP